MQEDPIHINEEGATIIANAIEKDANPTTNKADAKTRNEETGTLHQPANPSTRERHENSKNCSLHTMRKIPIELLNPKMTIMYMFTIVR